MAGPIVAVQPPVPGPLQAAGLARVLDVSAPIRAVAAFLLVVALGGMLRWRYGPFVDRSIEASLATPVRSIAYGMAAHATIVFFGVYLANQLVQWGGLGRRGADLAVALGLLVLLLAGALGFTVVGSILVAVASTWGDRSGLVAGAAIAGIAGFLEPTVGGLLWFLVVSMGIGGPARRWLHADAIDDL